MDPHYEQKLEKQYNMMFVKPHSFAMFFGISGEASIKERKVVEDGAQERERQELNKYSWLQRNCAVDEKVKTNSLAGTRL